VPYPIWQLALQSSDGASASSSVVAERLFVWTGGGVFVASLAATVYVYAVIWSDARPGALSRPAALAVNAALIAVFASHHSLFARDAVKAWLAQHLPRHLLRSFYVWIASLLWLAVLAGWQTIGGLLFHTNALLTLVQLTGFILSWRSVRAIDPLELAGIRSGDSSAGLQTGGPYRWVRHPLYLGWALMVFGAARLTGDRLAFAVMTSAYLIVAIPWEERSLERSFGEAYRRYKALVRWRVIPYVY
jgi:protein-S-isoprenylcysteine O-methyltransferase Ste14